MPEFSETFLIILSEVFMENKTFIQLNTLPAGYNGFAMTADFPCSEEDEYSRTSEAENYSVKYMVVPISDGHRNSVGCAGKQNSNRSGGFLHFLSKGQCYGLISI